MSRKDPLAEAVRAIAEPSGERLDIETLVAWSRGELPAAEHDALEERLASSPEDAELLLALQEFHQDLPEAPATERDSGWDRLAGRLAAEAGLGAAPVSEVKAEILPFVPPSPRPRPWMAWALAASLVYGLVTSVAVVRSWRGTGGPVGAGATALANVEVKTLKPLQGAGDRSEGGERISVSAGAPAATLILVPPVGLKTSASGDFEVRVLGPGGRELYRGRLVPSSEESLTLSLPTSGYPEGVYEIEVHGGEATTAPGHYEFEIAAAAGDPLPPGR